MKLSVIIPNYNGINFLSKCLDTLSKQDFEDYEIIVVDDGSTQNGIKELVFSYPRTKIICHDRNYGFAKSVNDGIKASESEYVMLLNNDAYVDDGCLKILVETMDSEKSNGKVFSVQCKMLSAVNHAIIDNAGDFYNILGWARTRGKDKLADSFNKPSEVFSACGGAAIYRRDVLNEIGLFDETHFAYLEDVDLGYRAKLHGYINKYEPSARVFHEGSATSGSRYNEFKVRLAARNSILVRYKNQTAVQKILNFPAMELGVIVKQVYFIRKGLGKAYRNGIREGRYLKTTPDVQRVLFDSSKRKRAWKIELELIRNLIY